MFWLKICLTGLLAMAVAFSYAVPAAAQALSAQNLSAQDLSAQDLSVYETPDTQQRVPLQGEPQTLTTQALQQSLVELLGLYHSVKQAHWNLTGPLFISLHPQLQEFAEDYLEAADLVAERKLALGIAADGRPATLVRSANLPDFPGDRLKDYEAIDRFSQALVVVTGRMRDRIQRLDSLDLVSQDVLIGIERTLAKHLWMLRALQR